MKYRITRRKQVVESCVVNHHLGPISPHQAFSDAMCTPQEWSDEGGGEYEYLIEPVFD